MSPRSAAAGARSTRSTASASRGAGTSARRPRSPAASRAKAARAARRAAVRRRRRNLALTLLTLGVLGALVWPLAHHAVRELTLPLRHEDIIRQQARDKHVDPALVAAVIYAESHFRDGQRSSAGAEGLMQLTPATAKDIARKSGGVAFEVADLGTPQVNIAYGTYYLRYLLDRYAGNEALALAAYNGGEGNVDRWIVRARTADRNLRVQDIPFPETRAYVTRVMDAQRKYRANYASELGL